jgi:26S proteasome non-ATPase regulatory subunit 10
MADESAVDNVVPGATASSQHPSLAEACRASSLNDVLIHLQRLAPARGDPDIATKAQDPSRPHAWYIDAVDSEGRTAFHWAVALRSVQLAEQLLAEPFFANPATEDNNGTTTLLTAIAAQVPMPLVRVIVDAGARIDPNWINKAEHSSGNTALHSAASRAAKDIVRLLLEHGADPLITSRMGLTPLHKAVPRGSIELAEELISHVRKTDLKNTKRFVNMQDANGDTALHHASAENNKEFGEMLLRNGADRVIKNKLGREFWQQ